MFILAPISAALAMAPAITRFASASVKVMLFASQFQGQSSDHGRSTLRHLPQPRSSQATSVRAIMSLDRLSMRGGRQRLVNGQNKNARFDGGSHRRLTERSQVRPGAHVEVRPRLT